MRVFFLPDFHAPASSLPIIKWAAKERDKFKPDIVIQLGDLVDAEAWSKYPKSSDDDSPSLEWEKTEHQLQQLYKYFPELVIVEGNHCARIMRKAFQDAQLPKKFFKTIGEVLGFDGWEFYTETKPLIVDGVGVIHGDEVNSPLTLIASRMGRPVVRGHTHQAGIVYTRFFDRQIFAMECGMLADEDHNAFGYAAKNPKRGWCGVGTMVDGENPQLISYY